MPPHHHGGRADSWPLLKKVRRAAAAKVQSPGGTSHIEADVRTPGGRVVAKDRLEPTPNESLRSLGGGVVHTWHRQPGANDSPATAEAARQLNLQADRDSRKRHKVNPSAVFAKEEKVLKSAETKKAEKREVSR